MATGVSKMHRSLRAGHFGRRSEEFVAKDHVEVEWQLEATDLDLAESWLKKHSPTSDLAAIPDSTKELLDAYYDTEDWRSYRAGYSLRVCRDGESAEETMTFLTPAEGALRQRRDTSEPLKGNAKIPKVTRGPVGERVRRLAGARDLRLLFKVRTRRRVFELLAVGADGNIAVGEIALDESEIFGETPAHLSRIEVEIDSSVSLHAGVAEFVDEMRDALGLRATELAKFELGLSAAGLNPSGASNLDLKQTIGPSSYKARG
jgi:inorganic triphosphatase YgiF